MVHQVEEEELHQEVEVAQAKVEVLWEEVGLLPRVEPAAGQEVAEEVLLEVKVYRWNKHSVVLQRRKL